MSELTRPHRLATTRWTLLTAARDAESPAAQAAWAALCELYWYPVYAFIRRTGHREDEALDLTQGFFARPLDRSVFAQAQRERGRFRTFLLTSVRNFVAKAHEREVADKRGGGQVPVQIDLTGIDERYARDSATVQTPGQIYDAAWARATLADAMTRLEHAQESPEAHRRFSAMKPLLTDDAPGAYEPIAKSLQMTEGALRVATHRLRRQYGGCLREAIGETVAGDELVDAELRYLLAVVSRP